MSGNFALGEVATGVAMRSIDYAVGLISAIIMIVGGYQFYFFCQRHHMGNPREFNTRFDDLVPFWPSWVWIYSCLYYPVILYLVFAQESFQSFNYTAFSYLVLLAMQCLVFFFFPVRIPAHWRSYVIDGSLSRRLLALLQRYDSVSNSIPSMHVSVASLTAIHLYNVFAADHPSWAMLAFGFPIIIALSAIFTKQHYLADLLPGAAFGWLAYWVTAWMLA